nr:ABC transporter ATP-binding protein [Polyangiaceae bacterium]
MNPSLPSSPGMTAAPTALWVERASPFFLLCFPPSSAAEKDQDKILGRLEKTREGFFRHLELKDTLTEPMRVELPEHTEQEEEDLLWEQEPAIRGPALMQIRAAYRMDAPANGVERMLVKRLLCLVLGERAGAATALIDGVTGHLDRAENQGHPPLAWELEEAPMELKDVLDGLNRDEPRALYFRSATSLVSYLILRRGVEPFRRFLLSFDPRKPAQAIREVYGQDMEALALGWSTEVERAKTASTAMGVGDFIGMIGGLLRPFWRSCLVVLLAMLLDVALTSAMPLSVKALIDHAITPRDARMMTLILGVLAGLGLVTALVGLVRDFLFTRLVGRLLNDLRVSMLARVQALSMSYFARHPTGDTLSRFGVDLASVESILTNAMPYCVNAALHVLISGALLFTLDRRLALMALLLSPLGAIAPRIFGGRAAAASYARKQQEAQVNASVQETLAGQQVIKTFRLAGHLQVRFQDQLHGLVNHHRRERCFWQPRSTSVSETSRSSVSASQAAL